MVLPVELDIKVPPDRLYIPEYLSEYIQSVDTIVPLIDSPSALNSVLLIPISGEDANIGNSVSSQLIYYTRVLDGIILSSGERIALSIGGVYRLFNILTEPSCGRVSLKTRVTLECVGSSSTVAERRGFNQIGGYRNIIQLLVSTIKRPLMHKELYSKYGLTPPRGILLFGPPGTGKTLLVKALSDELEGSLVICKNGTDLAGDDSYAKIHSLVESAKQGCIEAGYSSIVIFIDEIDSLCPSREAGVSEAERKSVAALLTEMDGLSGKTTNIPLVVIGATNRPNAIDLALRRPGRFEREIEIPPPDMEDRKDILRVLSAEKYCGIWSPSATELCEIASLTHGFVGADLASLISFAAFQALESGQDKLNQDIIKDQLVRVRPSALRELAVAVPKTSWNDIGGYEDVKSQLIEAVIWPLLYADAFDQMAVEPPRGVLLYGPPGCSKTMMARAVATESSMNFIAVKGPEIFSKWVGESEQAIRELFRKARQASPCVIFFDEIDAIATQRDSGDGGVGNRVLTQLLTEMDGVSASKKVVVIAATNRPHVLDPALVRPGRLDKLVYVGLPNKEARVRIWENGLQKIPHEDSIDLDSTMEKLAIMTESYSGAEIVMLLKEAAITCIKENMDGNLDIADSLEALSISSPIDRENLILKLEHLEKASHQVTPRTDLTSLHVYDVFRNRTR